MVDLSGLGKLVDDSATLKPQTTDIDLSKGDASKGLNLSTPASEKPNVGALKLDPEVNTGETYQPEASSKPPTKKIEKPVQVEKFQATRYTGPEASPKVEVDTGETLRATEDAVEVKATTPPPRTQTRTQPPRQNNSAPPRTQQRTPPPPRPKESFGVKVGSMSEKDRLSRQQSMSDMLSLGQQSAQNSRPPRQPPQYYPPPAPQYGNYPQPYRPNMPMFGRPPHYVGYPPNSKWDSFMDKAGDITESVKGLFFAFILCAIIITWLSIYVVLLFGQLFLDTTVELPAELTSDLSGIVTFLVGAISSYLFSNIDDNERRQ